MLCGSLLHLHLDLSEGGMQVGRCQDHQERRQKAEMLTEPLKRPSRQCSHLHGKLGKLCIQSSLALSLFI